MSSDVLSRPLAVPASTDAKRRAHRAAQTGVAFALGLLMPTLIYWPLAGSPAPDILDVFVRPGLYLTDGLVAVVILLGLASVRRSRLRRHDSLALPLLGLVLLALLGAPLALSPAVAAYTALRWALAGVLLVVLLASDLPLNGLAAGLLASLAINAILGIAQVAGQAPLGLPGELALPPEATGAAVIGAARWLRPYGLTFHPNVLAGFLVVGLLMALPRVRSTGYRLLWWLCWAALLFSVSRSAWIALALTLPPLVVWMFATAPDLRRPLALTALGAAVIAVALVLPLRPLFAERLNVASAPASQPVDDTARSVSDRLALQSVAVGVIAGRPLTGVGAGNSPLAVQFTTSRVIPQPVHNLPLLLASETGVVGGALWLWLWLAPLAMLWTRWRRDRRLTPDAAPRASSARAAAALALAWLALGVIGLFDFYPWGLESGRLLAVVTLALFARSFDEL